MLLKMSTRGSCILIHRSYCEAIRIQNLLSLGPQSQFVESDNGGIVGRISILNAQGYGGLNAMFLKIVLESGRSELVEISLNCHIHV